MKIKEEEESSAVNEGRVAGKRSEDVRGRENRGKCQHHNKGRDQSSILFAVSSLSLLECLAGSDIQGTTAERPRSGCKQRSWEI